MAKNTDSDTTLVYSTELGKVCPSCSKAQANCICNKPKQLLVRRYGIVRVSLETKGRNGKGVTIITGLPVSEDGLKDIAKKLKQKCGTGGTVKEGSIEIQGDHRTILMGELEGQGYKVKRSGGC